MELDIFSLLKIFHLDVNLLTEHGAGTHSPGDRKLVTETAMYLETDRYSKMKTDLYIYVC